MAVVDQVMRGAIRDKIADGIASITFHVPGYRRIRDEEAATMGVRLEQTAFDNTGTRGIDLYVKTAAAMVNAVLKDQRQRLLAQQDQQGAPAGSASTLIHGSEDDDSATLDIRSTGRETLVPGRVEELLKPLQSKPKNVKAVYLGNKSWGQEAAATAAAIFQDSDLKSTLEYADISDIIAGQSVEDSVPAIETLSKSLSPGILKTLNISDNALGESGLRAFAPLIQGSMASLEELYLCNIGCSEYACAALNEMYTDAPLLNTLHLYNNMSGSGGAIAIAQLLERAPEIRDVRLSACRVEEDGMMAVASALDPKACNVTSLDLSDNAVGAGAIKELVRIIGKMTNLKCLVFGDVNLGNTGVVELCDALLLSGAPLETLAINSNEMTGGEAMDRVCKYLSEGKHRLRSLNLSENELKSAGLRKLARCINKRPVEGEWLLETIRLEYCEAGSEAALSISKACTSNVPNLRSFNIDGNMISEDAVEEITELFAGFREGVLKSLDENDPDGADEDDDDEEELEDDDDVEN